MVPIKRPWRKHRLLIMIVSITQSDFRGLHVDEDLYSEARTQFKNLIRKKEKVYFEEKLKDNTVNPKNIWETLKELGLPNDRPPSSDICLKKNEGLTFDPFTISEVFQKFIEILLANQSINFRQLSASLTSIL